jgi:L-ascorbate metabolism protein UlaG (beta-lactamase superfamily)
MPEAPDCALEFIANATCLLRFGTFEILTDPNFLHRGQRAYLGYGLTSRRLTEPSRDVDELPALDAIVLSHMHGDHWDRIAKRHLDRGTPVVTTPKAARALTRQGFAATTGLATWASTTLMKRDERLQITAMPGRHAPGLARRLLPPVMGSLLEYRRGDELVLRLYISGDTLLIDELREIPRRYDAPDVALLHLGGTTLPGGLVVSMDGEAGAALVRLLDPTVAVPIHHSDYTVFKSPLADFEAAMAKRGIGAVARVVQPGEVLPLSARSD